MNFKRLFSFFVLFNLSFLIFFPSWSRAQTPFDFSEIQISDSNKKSQFPLQNSPLISIRRVYQDEEKKGVYYFNKIEQKRARVLVKKGLFYQAQNPHQLINSQYAPPLVLPKIIPPPPVDQAQRSGYAIFVFDQNQNLYLSFKAKQGKIHHSSLLAGIPILCAGEMQIFQGQLKYINNRSGHYQPPPKTLKSLLKFLEQKGVDLKKVQIEFLGIDL